MLSLLGVTEGPLGRLTANVGHERIPDNWYRRSLDFPLSISDIVLQVAELITLYPWAASICGNTGTVNSFVRIDLGDLRGGVFSSGDLVDPVKLSCFLYRVSQILVPAAMRNLFTNTIAGIGLFAGLGCPVLQAIERGMFAQFPGTQPGMFM